jgi:PAS domain S-box-containing protein
MKIKLPTFFYNVYLSPKLLRIGLILALVLYSVFGFLDFFAMPSNFSIAWTIRYAIFTPVLIITYLLSYYKPFYKYGKAILFLLITVGQLGILAMIVLSNSSDLAYNSYYVGLILVMLWSSFIFRISFQTTIYITLSTILYYNISVVLFQKTYLFPFDSIQWTILLNNNFFLVFSALLVLIAAYLFDYNIKANNFVNSELIKEKEQLRLAKEKIEENESNLTSILENSLDSIWSINTNHEIIYLNEVFANSFQNSFGVKISKGSNLLQALPKDLTAIWKDRYERVLRNNRFDFEDVIDLIDRKIYIHVVMYPIIVDKKVIGASFYGRDVTMTKLYESQLIAAKDIAEENQRILSTLVKNLPGFVYRQLFDRDWTTILISEPCYEITGYTADEFIGNKVIAFNDIILPEYQEHLWNRWNKQIELKENLQEVYQIRTKDGTKKWVWEQGCGVFAENGDVIALEGYIFDITDYKNTQIELVLAKEKAEESDRLKSSFLANMSHEIRTPMNSIIGFSNQLKKPNLSPETRDTFISYIQNNGEILMKLINDILDISKIESSQLSIKKEKVLLIEILNELVVYYRTTHTQFEFILQVHEGSENLVIFTDKVRLRQVLINLVNNAVNYGNNKVEFGYTLNDKNAIQFFVKDNGPGIPKDKYNFIFERFSQLETIENIGGKMGVGLGLSICKLIIENLNGEIWVESELGQGSTFYFTIPLIENL